MKETFLKLAEQYRDDIVATASEMIRINSQSTQEGDMAAYTATKMRELGYDEVVTDTYGSVFGTIRGTGGGNSVTLNCHLDIVDEGDHSKWTHAPYSGDIADGRIWGRGASDTKGTFAIQLHTAAILKKEGLRPKGDIVVAGVICEENASFGSMMQSRDNYKLTDYAIVGEASENDIAIGSRGRFCVVVTVRGRSCHASVPHQGKNPFDFLAKFIPLLPTIEPSFDELFGPASMTPTAINSSEKGTNIVPNEVELYMDYRMAGSDTQEIVLGKVQKLVDQCAMDGITVSLRALYFPLKTYTGYEGEGFQGSPPFTADADAAYIQICKKTLEDLTGRKIAVKPWPFATDTGYFSAKGVKCLGYSPAEVKLCHTTQDSVDIDMMQESTAGYLALATTLANLEK